MKGGYDGVINESDIDFMHESLDETKAHRERPVTVIYLEVEVDPVSGVELGETEETREVSAVVTEISSASGANPDRSYEGGIAYIEGDIKVDVKIERIEDIARKIERMAYDGDNYEILAIDKKGIGRRNRYEIIGRVIA